jgi:hypothetical protein
LKSTQRLPGWTTDVPKNPVQSTEEEKEEEEEVNTCLPNTLSEMMTSSILHLLYGRCVEI